MERYFEINERGHNIRCKIYCQDIRNIRQIVVFCHGFGGHKDNNAAARFGEKLLGKFKKAALVTFDWPCHGDDVKKKLTLADCDTYLGLVTAHVKQKFGTEELYAYATSFGGYLLLKYIARHGSPFRKMVLRCPALNMYESMTRTIMTAADLEKMEKGKDVPVGFDRKVLIGPAFLQELQETDIRTWDFLDWAEDMLLIHGTADEIIPFREARDFSENQLIELIAAEGVDHRFRNQTQMDLAIKQILEFFDL